MCLTKRIVSLLSLVTFGVFTKALSLKEYLWPQETGTSSHFLYVRRQSSAGGKLAIGLKDRW
jgi:hypothetical protein